MFNRRILLIAAFTAVLSFQLVAAQSPRITPVSGQYDRLELVDNNSESSWFQLGNISAQVLIIPPRTKLLYDDRTSLKVDDSIVIQGSPQNWIEIYPADLQAPKDPLNLCADQIIIQYAYFAEPVTLEGDVLVEYSHFRGRLFLNSWGEFEVRYCLFEDGLVIGGFVQEGALVNNTVVNGRGAGVELWRYRELELTNNIIAFNRSGIWNGERGAVSLTYNDVFGNREDYVSCQPGEGSIAQDPVFINQRAGDFRLAPGSPCIDRGSPQIQDPDGSRGDLGAFPFQYEVAVDSFCLIRPNDGDIINSTEVTFLWTPVRPARNYIFCLDNELHSFVKATPYPSLRVDLDTLGFDLDNTNDFQWWVRAVLNDDTVECRERFQFRYIPLGVEENLLPESFDMIEACPNPFNSSVQLRFYLSESSQSRLSIYNTAGQLVEILGEAQYPRGLHFQVWNAAGRPAGLYIARINSARGSKSIKLILVE